MFDRLLAIVFSSLDEDFKRVSGIEKQDIAAPYSEVPRVFTAPGWWLWLEPQERACASPLQRFRTDSRSLYRQRSGLADSPGWSPLPEHSPPGWPRSPYSQDLPRSGCPPTLRPPAGLPRRRPQRSRRRWFP